MPFTEVMTLFGSAEKDPTSRRKEGFHGFNTGNTLRHFPQSKTFDREKDRRCGHGLCLRCGYRCMDPDGISGKKSLKKTKGMSRGRNYDFRASVDV